MKLSFIDSHLNRTWRLFATGLCFATFGLGALLLNLWAFLFVECGTGDTTEKQLRVQRMLQRSFAFFCRMLHRLGTMDFHIDGFEKLQDGRQSIIIANHPSLIDYVLIASALPQCDCLVKSSLWHNPWMRGVLRQAGYIPNRSPEILLEQCIDRLSTGRNLLIFPEGTRSYSGRPQKLQRGAAQIAVRSNSDIWLVRINVSPSFLTKEIRWYQTPDKKPIFHVKVEDKISTEALFSNTKHCSIAARLLHQRLSDFIFNQQHAPLSPNEAN